MPDAEQTRPLQGCTVWVTRPAHQAQSVLTHLAALGATTLALPLLKITPAVDAASQARLAAANTYDLLIFVSANAVEYSAAYHSHFKNGPDLAVIGQATAAKCQEYRLTCNHIPQQADTEGLLALARLQQVAGQKILIVRGQGGRERLAETLRTRGAQVDYAEVYVRDLPDLRLAAAQANVDVIMLTSSDILRNLATLARRDKQAWVFDRQLIVIHARIAGLAGELGFTLKPLVASEASDSGMIETLCTWERSGRRMTQ